MSISTEITRIQNAKAAIKTAIEGKGVTVPDATLLDGMAALIESIEAGGGNVVVGTFTTTDDITSNIVITHNLGVKPKFFAVVSASINGYSSDVPLLVFAYLYKYSDSYYGIRYQKVNDSQSGFGNGLITISGTADKSAWYRFNIDETTVTIKQSRLSSTYGMGASRPFFWIAYGE